jgi:ABC-type uncharacterized transport system permease subunit
MIEFAPYLTVALIYLWVAAGFWLGAKKQNSSQTSVANRLIDKGKRLRWHTAIIAIGLLLHGGLLYASLFSNGLNLGFANALSAIFWLTVLIYWLTDLKHHLHSLQAFVLPPAAFFVLLQKLMPETHFLPYADQPLFKAHLIVAMLAYSLFIFAALHALLMMVAERSLHRKPTLLQLPDFPPLLTMETLLFRVIGLGFILLTFTLITGVMFSELIFGQPVKFNHKNIFTILSWVTFGSLLLGRYIYGWRGRKAIRWTLSGSVFLLLAYAGSKFVWEILLHR